MLPNFSRTPKAFSLDKLGKIIWMNNQEPLKTLEMVFPFREIISDYEIKPLDYISFMIGYEGKGSLKSYLKE